MQAIHLHYRNQARMVTDPAIAECLPAASQRVQQALVSASSARLGWLQ